LPEPKSILPFATLEALKTHLDQASNCFRIIDAAFSPLPPLPATKTGADDFWGVPIKFDWD
jgi:hypothetical protein